MSAEAKVGAFTLGGAALGGVIGSQINPDRHHW